MTIPQDLQIGQKIRHTQSGRGTPPMTVYQVFSVEISHIDGNLNRIAAISIDPWPRATVGIERAELADFEVIDD